MSFASESSWKKHLFLLHGIKRPQPWDYCDDIRRENHQLLQPVLVEVTEMIELKNVPKIDITEILQLNILYIF